MPQETPIKPKGPTICYHEDDYCMVEIVPRENMAHIDEESNRLKSFTRDIPQEENNEIYLINEMSVPLSTLQIKPEELDPLLELLDEKRYDQILTGYGSTMNQLHIGAVGYGSNWEAFFYDVQDGIVSHIWLVGHVFLDEETVINCLHAIGQRWPLLLQDWERVATVDLSSRAAIEEYIMDHEEDDDDEEED